MTTNPTKNFKFSRPLFDSGSWHDDVNGNFTVIDALFKSMGLTAVTRAWATGTAFAVDDRAIDPLTGITYQCNVAHTSGMTTMADDIAAHPTWWTVVTTGVVVREGFQSGTTYYVGDFVYQTSEYLAGIVETEFIGGANLRANIGNLGVIYDIKEPMTAIASMVRTDAPQSFTAAQKGQARANIGANVLSGFRNKFINGNFIVNQRPISSLAAGQTAFVTDRWILVNGTNQTLNISLIDAGLYTIGPVDPRNALALGFLSPPTTGSVSLVQRVEDVRTLAKDKATASLLVLESPWGAGAINSDLVYGGGGSATAFVSFGPISAGAGLKTAVADIPPTVDKIIGTNSYLSVGFTWSPRSTGSHVVTDFSLVRGDASAESNPFAPRHPQQEFALCQRYYTVVATNDGGASTYKLCTSAAGSLYNSAQSLPVPMRISSPTITQLTPPLLEGSVATMDFQATSTGFITYCSTSAAGGYRARNAVYGLSAEL